MTMFLAPYTAIADIDGSPLDAGFLFFGGYGKDPELFPIEVFWDVDFTVPAAQPIRTRNGYPVRNGSPAKVYLKTAQHSIAIKNIKGAFVLVDFFNKGWDASFVVDGDQTQYEINENVRKFSEKQAIHNKSYAAFTDFLTANEINNKSTTDLSLKLQVVNDEGIVSKLRLSKGEYLINSPVVFSRSFDFDFDPDAYFKIGPSGSIAFEGTATLIGKPTSAILKESKTININHGGSLKPFDLICIYNPSDRSFNPMAVNYRDGEYLRVASVPNNNSIVVFGRPYEDYVASAVDVYKINAPTINFNRFNVLVDPTNTANSPVRFTFCKDLDLSNYYNDASRTAGISIDRCYNVDVANPMAVNMSALTGTNYGVSIGNSQKVRLHGGDSSAARHCVTVGGGNAVCSVPNREISVINTVMKNGSTTNITSADFHANTAESHFKNCVMDGLSLGGKNLTVEGCTIIGRSIDGMAVTVGGLIGGYIDLIDCNLIIDTNIVSNYGVMSFVLEQDLLSDLTINIRDLKINGKSASAYNLIRVLGSPSVQITKKITINLDVDCKLVEHGSILYVNGGANYEVLPNVEINMRDVKTVKKGVYYVHPTATAIAPTTKLNLPIQKGSTTISASGNTTGFILGSTVTLDYSYPIPPSVVHSVGTDGTWNPDGANYGMKPVTSMLHTNSNSAVRFALTCPAAIPNNSYKISYNVGM